MAFQDGKNLIECFRVLFLYGDKDVLFELQSTLLSAGNAPKDSGSDAVQRAAHDCASSDYGDPAYDRKPQRKETIGERA